MDIILTSSRSGVKNLGFNNLAIPFERRKPFNDIVTAAKNRKAWLQRLTGERGQLRPFAEKVGVAETYLSLCRSSKSHRNLGDALARRIEKRLGMVVGQLDQPPPRELGDQQITNKAVVEEPPTTGESEMQLGNADALILARLTPEDRRAVLNFALDLLSRQHAQKRGS